MGEEEKKEIGKISILFACLLAAVDFHHLEVRPLSTTSAAHMHKVAAKNVECSRAWEQREQWELTVL